MSEEAKVQSETVQRLFQQLETFRASLPEQERPYLDASGQLANAPTEVERFVDRLAEFRGGLEEPERQMLDTVVLLACGAAEQDVSGYGLSAAGTKRLTLAALVALGVGLGTATAPLGGTAQAAPLEQPTLNGNRGVGTAGSSTASTGGGTTRTPAQAGVDQYRAAQQAQFDAMQRQQRQQPTAAQQLDTLQQQQIADMLRAAGQINATSGTHGRSPQRDSLRSPAIDHLHGSLARGAQAGHTIAVHGMTDFAPGGYTQPWDAISGNADPNLVALQIAADLLSNTRHSGQTADAQLQQLERELIQLMRQLGH
jgi:hypothetical protein